MPHQTLRIIGSKKSIIPSSRSFALNGLRGGYTLQMSPHRLTPLGSPTLPPQGWTPQVTPEGDMYFWNPQLRIVTPATITQEVDTQLRQARSDLMVLCGDRDVTTSSIELFLDPTRQCGEVSYYFIDKINRHPFWATAVLTSELGLAPFDTQGFLSEHSDPEASQHFDDRPQQNLRLLPNSGSTANTLPNIKS